jgi:hypothetical protein
MSLQSTVKPRPVGRQFCHSGKPDFFIVGAPRCGTTAMFRYLSRHPEIYFSDRKEMHFFGSDLRFGPQFYRRNLNDYLAEFASRNGELRSGEASVWYLFSKTAATEIKKFNPDASIVIMLRQPAEMLYSLYYMFRYDRNEHLPTFEQGLDAESTRRGGGLITRQTYFPQGLVYTDVARYADQVQRYFETFGRDRVHVILYDHFAEDTMAAYCETLEFLGVDSSRVETEFEVINGNRTVKSSFLNSVINDGLVRIASLALRPLLSRKVFVALRRIREQVMKSNLHFEQRPPLAPETRARLNQEFAPDIERLGRLLNRDLSHWCEP